VVAARFAAQDDFRRQIKRAVTYLITFACYGAHVHGDESGSVDRDHNLPGSRMLDSNPTRLAAERHLMDQPAYKLDESRRDAVRAAILDRAKQRGWTLLAAHVRTNHVHVIINSDATPEHVMNDLKAYASRNLNALGLDATDRKRWARHGSTRWLPDRDSVDAAIQYVVEKQGDAMAVYISDSLRR
jgi:REP element-mobilizing transposase RayT